jgi:hypothetical protein
LEKGRRCLGTVEKGKRCLGPTVFESDTGYDIMWNTVRAREMDHPVTHLGRNYKNPRGPNKGNNGERKILVDATGRNSGPPTRGK